MTPDEKPPAGAPGEWSEQERALLTAARDDRMPGALERGVRAALEQRLAAAPVRSPVQPGRGLFARASLWGTLGVALLGVTGYAVLHGGGARPALPPLAATLAAPPSSTANATPPSAAARSAPASSSEPEPTIASSRPVAAATARRGPAERPDPLREELQLLQRARTALRRGELQDAARHLDAYVLRFQQGVLRPESEALRIELDVRRGRPALAQRNAERFSAAYPEHPLRERVQNLVAHP